MKGTKKAHPATQDAVRIKYGIPLQPGNISEYPYNAIVHGGRCRRSFCVKILWVIVFFLSLYFFGKFFIKSYNKWDQSPVTISFAENLTPVWQIPFPAVTICPETKAKAEFLNFTAAYHYVHGTMDYDLTDIEKERVAAIAHVCDSHLFRNTSLDDMYTNDICVERLREMAPSFDEMLMFCKWRNTPQTCDDLFSEVLTEEGVCYTFNMISAEEMFHNNEFHSNYKYLNNSKQSTDWSLEGGYSKISIEDQYPERVLGAGAKAGLNVLLRLYNYDLDYICRGPVQGFKILLHTPGEIPQISKQYFRIPLNQEAVVSVRPNMITTSDDLKDYPPNKRQCYFNNERNLRFFKIYTQQNCELECLSNFTLGECGCVKFSMPRDDNTKICGTSNIECYNNAEVMLLEKEVKEGLLWNEENIQDETSCNCLPACTSIDYETEISQGNFDWEPLLLAFQSPLDDFPGVQMARLTIFFKETQFLTSKRTEVYSRMDLLYNSGGLFALFIGILILCFVELVNYRKIK